MSISFLRDSRIEASSCRSTCSVPSATFLSGWIVYSFVGGQQASPEGSCGVKGFVTCICFWLVIPSFVTCLSGTTHSFLSGSTTLLSRLNLSSPSPPLPERSDPSRESGVSYLSNKNLSRLIALGNCCFWH